MLQEHVSFRITSSKVSSQYVTWDSLLQRLSTCFWAPFGGKKLWKMYKRNDHGSQEMAEKTKEKPTKHLKGMETCYVFVTFLCYAYVWCYDGCTFVLLTVIKMGHFENKFSFLELLLGISWSLSFNVYAYKNLCGLLPEFILRQPQEISKPQMEKNNSEPNGRKNSFLASDCQK